MIMLSSASAATVAYYRFEDNLTNSANPGTGDLTATGSVTTTSLAGSGATSDFFNPVPQTGASNTQTASGFSGSENNGFSTGDFFDLSGNDAFTIEALFNASSTSNIQTIAAQWLTVSGGRSFYFNVRDGGQLALYASGDGNNAETYISNTSGLQATAGKDYYAAAAFSTSGVSLYLQNLTDGGPLSSQSFNVNLTNVRNSGGDFTVGGFNNNFNYAFSGSIDEVRLSDTKLSESELLTVPEPSSFLLALIAGGVGVLVLRRNRCGK